MKILLFLLLLTPVMQTGKTLNFSIKVLDQKGKPVPDCTLKVSIQGVMGYGKYVTDRNGLCNFQSWTNVMVIDVQIRNHQREFLTLNNLDKKNEGDTIYATIRMRPYTNHKPK